MTFHLGYELPVKEEKVLNHEVPELTSEEVKIVKTQIRKNSEVIGYLIEKLDLFINKEGHPKDTLSIVRLRKRLNLLMEENDNFRKVFWKHAQVENLK